MKINLYLKSIFIFITLITFSLSGMSQGHETFDNLNASGSTYTTPEDSYIGDNEIVWHHRGSRTISAGSADEINGISCGFGGETNDGYPGYVKATVTGGVGELSFNWRSFFTGGDETDRSIKVFINNEEVQEFLLPAMGVTYNENLTINKPGNVIIELRTSGTRQTAIDDIVWTEYVTVDPLLMAMPMSLSGFTYQEESGPSASQFYNLSGLNLDPAIGAITVSTATNFEVSLDDITFSDFVEISYVDGEFYDVPIYVRLKENLTTNDYSETITNSGGTAETINVDVSGSVTPLPPELTLDGYTQNFATFISAVTFPAGWEPDDIYSYEGDFGSGTAGGLRGNGVLGFQLTGTAPNNEFKATLTLINNTGQTIENLDVEYLGKVAREVEGTPKWVVYVDGVEIPELEYSTLSGVDELKAHTVAGLSIPQGENLIIEWFTTSAETSGTRRQIGISDVNVNIQASPQAANPVFNPPAGTYIEAFDLEITTETEGATVFYKFDEADPWTEYTVVLPITTNTSVWAQATKDGMLDSEVVTANYEFVEGNIVSVAELTDIEVVQGTLFNELPLPVTVDVTLDDAESTVVELEVNWLEGDYNPALLGTQIILGDIILAGQITNTDGIQAQINVIVLEEIIEYEIVAVELFDDIAVEYGTLFENLVLPETATVTLENDATETLDITWLQGAYDGNTADTYTLTGELQLITGIINPNNFTATINVTVNPEAVEEVIAGWTFPESDIFGADLGLAENLGNEISREPAFEGNYNFHGGATTEAISTTSWSDGADTKYWVVEFSTLSYGELILSSAQQSSDTGPADFKVQYKYGSNDWMDLDNSIITVENNFTSGVLSEIPLPDVLNNKYSVSLRWIMTSNTAVNGDDVAGAGTNRIDDIIVKGFYSDDFKRIVTGVEELEDIEVEVFTTIFEELPLPETVTVFFDDEGSEDLQVIWIEGDYNGDVIGEYIIEGDLVLEENMENPEGIKASVNVFVQEPVVFYEAVFNVDMSTHPSFDPENDVVYIRGDMNDWAIPGTDDPNQLMSPTDDPMIWTITFELEEGTYAYKYYRNAGTGNPEGGDDRSIVISEDIVINDDWSTTSIYDITNEDININIYPNPATDNIIISTDLDISQITIYNSHGQIVRVIKNNFSIINLSSLKKGLYILKIYSKERTINQKIIIN